MAKQTLNGPNGIRIVLDSAEIFPDDPGAGTPAMVYAGKFSATYWCAADTGELNMPHPFILNAFQVAWLTSERVESAVAAFVESHS